MMTENEQIDLRNDLDAAYPCPDIDCDGVVEYETTGYWQCSECSFRTKHIENKTKLQGWTLRRFRCNWRKTTSFRGATQAIWFLTHSREAARLVRQRRN